MHLFLDESGNTGVHLLDAQQPVFALASTTLSTERAHALLEPLLSQGQTEAKYSRLKSSGKGQKALVNFFGSAELEPESTSFTVVDKRFYLAAQMVDKLIEPTLHEAGIDLYARDANVGLSNVWFHAGRFIFPHGGWERLQVAFLAALRERTPEKFTQFDQVLAKVAAASDPKYSDFVTGLLLARGRLDEFLGVYTEVEVFDPAVDAFALLVQKQMQRTKARFPVTHDRSKPLARSESFLRALMTPDAEARLMGYGDRKMELPLRISELSFADSDHHPQLQIADLVAGAAIDGLLGWSGARPSLPYHDALATTRLGNLFVGGLLPDRELAAAPAPKPGEQSIVDGQAAFLKATGFLDKAVPKL